MGTKRAAGSMTVPDKITADSTRRVATRNTTCSCRINRRSAPARLWLCRTLAALMFEQ